MPDIYKDLVMLKRGLILMVGAAGAGKSTTLAAMLNYRNETSSDHILTIEDPIEFLHSNKKSIINQREVGLDTKSFARALRSAVRAAPDVILVGEIRDRETMEAAIALAGTGHLCIATLHANNCAETWIASSTCFRAISTIRFSSIFRSTCAPSSRSVWCLRKPARGLPPAK